MSDLIDNAAAHRFEQVFSLEDGTTGLVFCDYGVEGQTRLLLHVEAEPHLRGTGASGRFMQALADHGRAHGLRFIPRCSYAVTWFQRHKDDQDLLA